MGFIFQDFCDLLGKFHLVSGGDAFFYTTICTQCH